MQLKIAFKQVQPGQGKKKIPVTDSIKDHTTDKSKRLGKFLKGNFDVNWVFTIEGGWHLASVVVSGKNFTHRAEGKTTNLYASIDLACHKMERQLSKTKDMVKEKNRGAEKTGVHLMEAEEKARVYGDDPVEHLDEIPLKKAG